MHSSFGDVHAYRYGCWWGGDQVLSQPFLWAPNGAGVLLSIFQLFLCVIFPATPPHLYAPFYGLGKRFCFWGEGGVFHSVMG
jgi:hypothetical protein